MSSAEARSWWDDDDHPHDSASLREAASRNAGRRFARVSDDRDGATTGRAAAGAGATAGSGERTLSRAHAADFASAFDLDGAFGAPRRRGDRDGEYAADGARVIVLERERTSPSDTDAFDAVDTGSFEAVAERESAAFDTGSFEPVAMPPEGRRTVRISGRPEERVHPRRLRELEPRRQRRSAVDRAASRPDRIALYAVLLGLFLVVLAAASGH